MIFGADDFDAVNQLFGMRIIQEKREALRSFVGETAAAGLFPSEVFIEDVDGMTGARELFAAQRAGRPATDNDIVSHSRSANDFLYPSPAREGWASEPGLAPPRTRGRAPSRTQRAV